MIQLVKILRKTGYPYRQHLCMLLILKSVQDVLEDFCGYHETVYSKSYVNA
jgi:hypothetical protein